MVMLAGMLNGLPGEIVLICQHARSEDSTMSLLDDLRDKSRDYWIALSSDSGFVDGSTRTFHVRKGVNHSEVELHLEVKEAEMLAILEDRDVDEAINLVIERHIEAEPLSLKPIGLPLVGIKYS